jgi:hypothetical protein
MSDARKTLESAVITALCETSTTTGLTIDKCSELVPRVIDEMFASSVRWAIESYLKELETAGTRR